MEDMRELGGGGGLEVHHRLWTWEELLVRECSLLLSHVHLQEDIIDLWQW